MNMNILRGEMAAHRMTIAQVAKEIGVSRNTLSDKLNEKHAFTVDEVAKICNLLEITNPNKMVEIFLHDSPNNGTIL